MSMENEEMQWEHDESIIVSSVANYNTSRPSSYLSLLTCSSPSSSLSSRTENPSKTSFFTVIDSNYSYDTAVEVILNEWVKIFNENPKNGTIKLFTVVIKCFDVNVCDSAFTDFNSSVMYARLLNCFRTQANTGLLLTPETIKRSTDIQTTLNLFTLIYRYHYNLFFSNDTHKKYFIFLRTILIKISQCAFVGPRLLATSFGLKIITGLTQSHNLEFIRNELKILLKEFFIKRYKDTKSILRETVMIELELWIQIDSNYYLNDFWKYIYLTLGDPSTSLQHLALKISKNLLNMNDYFPNIKLFTKEIVNVLCNLMLSKHEEVVISAIDLCSALPSVDEDDEEQFNKMRHIESIALELMFSENSNIAQFAAKCFVKKMVYPEKNLLEQLKVILIVVRGIPSHVRSIAFSFFVDAIFDLCPVLINFKLISQILTLKDYIDDIDKCNLMTLLMYAVKQLITGIRPEHKIACMGDHNDTLQLHISTSKKKEFTTYVMMHLLNQLKQCEDPAHAFSLWVLLQFIDFNMLQDKMITPDVFKYASSFYHNWNIPTILEQISKCLYIIMLDLKSYEKKLCLKFIINISQLNMNILIAAIENSSEMVSMFDQENALIKLWSLAKYNLIPDDLEPLKYLSYYVPNINTTQTHLIVSEYGLRAYMEVLRTKLTMPKNIENDFSVDQSSESITENTFVSFLNAMLNILKNYDPLVINICETAYLIVADLLRTKYKIDKTSYVLNDDQTKMLANFIFCVCKNCEDNFDLNTLKLIKVYIQLIQDGLIDINSLITLLQFIKMELVEHALQPVFNFFCNKETGNQLSRVINLYLVYMFENIISQKSGFKNSTIKDLISEANIISQLLGQCKDSVGKRLVSTNIHRHGIQYAMSDDILNYQFSDYPFKLFFWVLAFMSNTLIPFDAQRLTDFFLKKPVVQELITNGNDHVLRYLYKLQEICKNETSSFPDVAA